MIDLLPAGRRLLAALAVALLLVAGACNDDDDARAAAPSTTEEPAGEGRGEDEEEPAELRSYVTRPDLTPPVIDVTVDESDTPGLWFLAPKNAEVQTGPLIVDDAGELVWSLPLDERESAADFRVQTYQGQPVLTWWEGISHRGWGEGEFVIADTSYQEIARFPAGNGRNGDLHELQLTPEGTALVLVYEIEPADLTDFDGPADGYHFENYVQEIDVATGEVLLEWEAGDHVDMSETDVALDEDEDGSEDGAFDWFHVNSAALYDEDTIIVSARNTHAVYAIHRTTGELEWRLGGERSDFEMGEGTAFAWQHDARVLPDGTLTLFDNQANPPDELESRALVLRLDEAAGSATLVREVRHPEELRSRTQGNTLVLPTGGMVVGWGNLGRVSEFTADGTLVFDAAWAPADSYRVYRLPWTGRPTTVPDVVARASGGAVEVLASWNGATEVATWRVLGGDDPAALTELATAPKGGFETSIEVEGVAHVAVEALDAAGTVLARSEVVAAA